MSIGISNFFNQLGQELYAQWATLNFNEDRFPTLAANLLKKKYIHNKINRSAITNWVLENQLLPNQANIDFKFADLNLTAYSNDKFYIELLFWLDGTTSIHQHAFSGAFTVIEGSSIHSDYSFKCNQHINHALSIGEVKFNQIELLKEGDVRKIPPKQMSAHSLYHIDRPTISLIIRTYGQGYAQPQLSFLKPHIARDPFKKDASITQKIQTLKTLSKLNQDEYLTAYHQHISKLDLYSHIEIFIANAPLLIKFGALDKAIEQFEVKGNSLAPKMRAVAMQIHRTNQINSWRRKIKDADLKFFLAILLNSPNRQTSLQLINSIYPEQQAIELVIGWINQLITSEGLENVDINEPTLPFIDCLLNGLSFEQTIEYLAQDYDQQELDESSSILQQLYQQLKFESVLSPLFRSQKEQ